MISDEDGLPEHLIDEEILTAIESVQATDDIPPRAVQFYPSVGLLIKLVKGIKRLIKKSRLHGSIDDANMINLLSRLYHHFTRRDPLFDEAYWTPEQLLHAAREFLKECREISPGLLRYMLYDIFKTYNTSSGISTITIFFLPGTRKTSSTWTTNFFMELLSIKGLCSDLRAHSTTYTKTRLISNAWLRCPGKNVCDVVARDRYVHGITI